MSMRKLGFFTVMLGALVLSFTGQVRSVTPLFGQELGVVYAAVNDIAAVLAFNEATAAGATASVRRWAWAVLFLSGVPVLGMNTWHALTVGALPHPAAIAAGAGPVLLAWVLSQLISRVQTQQASRAETAGDGSAPGSTAEPVSHAGHEPSTPAAAEPTRRDESTDSGSTRTQNLPTLRQHGTGAEREANDGAADLIDRAERIERQELAETGKPISYRQAARRLGVRFDAAKAALQAARRRMDTTGDAGSRPAA